MSWADQRIMQDKKLKIGFVLNTLGLTGGVKVVFEYASRLQNRGHEVYIVHLLKIKPGTKGTLVALLKKLKYIMLGLFGKDKVDWFDLGQVKIKRLYSLNCLPKFDAIIATANETADYVAKLKNRQLQKFYFIQDYENWTRDAKLVDTTYKLPLRKIVISSWLKNLLKDKFKEEAEEVITNGVDFERYSLPQKKFNKSKKILMLYHVLPKKGLSYGLEAFKQVQKKFPDTTLTLFGVYKPIEELPLNTNFIFNPSRDTLTNLYKESDIFISPSLQEGCQLPPMEAMAAQCAVIATNVGGIPDYAVPDKTAIVVPPKDSDSIAKALIELLADEEKLKTIARNGYEHIKSFSWDKATDKFESLIRS